MTGYMIRSGRSDDIDQLATMNAAVHLQAKTGGEPHLGIAAWTRDLFDGHPTAGPADFLVAESAAGHPVASLVMIRQEWRLGDVQLPVAIIELVGTDPAHRGHR